MERVEQLDELINQALGLAYFIHGDKTLAIETVTNALNKLDVAVQAQDKRLYYEPQGRTTTRKARNKISFGEKHLLQRLIYIESEPFEKEKERSRMLSEEDMITHFIKHLIKLTLKRNSFYVALGISRLLHNYSTAETMEIYNLVVQDPDRVRDDYYYRSRKSRLMQEMKERFGNLLKVTKVNRGEERFEANGSPASRNGFVFDCLNHFTPWATACVIPSSLNPFSEIVQELAFDNPDPDAEHHVEINRTHSILHPDCFTRLVKALKLSPPNERLEIPNFFLSKSDTPQNRNEPPNFGQDDMEAIKSRLGEQSVQRKRFAAGLLKINVDGVALAELDLQHDSQVQFKIDEGAELIEVIGRNQKHELLLAACFVADKSGDNTKRITLEGGQEITFNLSPKTDRYGEIEETAVEIGYRETRAIRAAAIALQQRINRVGDWIQVDNLANRLKPALALALIALITAGVWFFAFGNKAVNTERAIVNPPSPKEEAKQPEVAQPSTNVPQPEQAIHKEPEPKQPSTDNANKSPQRERSQPLPSNLYAGDRRKTNPEDADSVRTRNSAPRVVDLSLHQVKAISIELSCDDAFCQQIKESMVRVLSTSKRFAFTESLDTADALLKISDIREQRDDRQGAILARLANRAGFILFPVGQSGSGAKYSGSSDEITQKLMRDLLKVSGKFEKR
jgi:hypothetical protein